MRAPATCPARHQALRAAIAWSEDLLESDERTVFRRLAVFMGGFTLEAAQAVATAGLSGDTLTTIAGLALIKSTQVATTIEIARG